MKAMVLKECGALAERRGPPLELAAWPEPEAGPGEIVVRVSACGVCRTELDEIEGRLPPPRLPVVPGHQVVGRVEARGPGAERFEPGDRVGVAWIHSACGRCELCARGLENLCPEFVGTGHGADGGAAELATVHEDFAHAIPEGLADAEVAPLLCAGAIGYRSLALTGLEDGQALGLTGFGASAHLVLQLARHRFPASEVFVFARDPGERRFAEELGAAWTGDTGDSAPRALDAVIDTTPAWRPVVEALRNLGPGGRLVINAIRKHDADRGELARLDYGERRIQSVANVTRADVRGLLDLAVEARLAPTVEEYPLEEAGAALTELAGGRIRGAKVLRVG